MELDETAFDALSTRYDVGFSQQIADHMADQDQRDIDLFDIKHLNDLVGEYRQKVRNLISLYRISRTSCENDGPLMHRVYATHESIFIRRQIADIWTLYRMAQTDSHELTSEYLRRLRKNSLCRTTSPYGRKYQAAA